MTPCGHIQSDIDGQNLNVSFWGWLLTSECVIVFACLPSRSRVNVILTPLLLFYYLLLKFRLISSYRVLWREIKITFRWERRLSCSLFDTNYWMLRWYPPAIWMQFSFDCGMILKYCQNVILYPTGSEVHDIHKNIGVIEQTLEFWLFDSKVWVFLLRVGHDFQTEINT